MRRRLSSVTGRGRLIDHSAASAGYGLPGQHMGEHHVDSPVQFRRREQIGSSVIGMVARRITKGYRSLRVCVAGGVRSRGANPHDRERWQVDENRNSHQFRKEGGLSRLPSGSCYAVFSRAGNEMRYPPAFKLFRVGACSHLIPEAGERIFPATSHLLCAWGVCHAQGGRGLSFIRAGERRWLVFPTASG